ncbi:unnamed protein product [Soboliphyme baturini]|uniref:HNF_C domain-containing protein n=1 Tax=Soboliphyme baturini TaxID=241478 RepID=A0A183IEE6_9BILA|nr:unnamed protein product [Soboliphyme baturini]
MNTDVGMICSPPGLSSLVPNVSSSLNSSSMIGNVIDPFVNAQLPTSSAPVAGFSAAPGAEHSAQKHQQQLQQQQQQQHLTNGVDGQKKIVMDYEADFPTLPAASPQYAIPTAVTQSALTQIFHIPSEERRYRDESDHAFGEKNQEQQECNTIMGKTSKSALVMYLMVRRETRGEYQMGIFMLVVPAISLKDLMRANGQKQHNFSCTVHCNDDRFFVSFV